jgi:guanosine-3',5'-bis(diphosphate) 3'-pyrophosphohydrolase
MSVATELLSALAFAADRHRDQRRKGEERAPYVNHLIEVAELLARVGGIEDRVTLLAAVLHDAVEDTDTTPEDIEKRFGPEVRAVVMEVTDDKSLPKAERKRLQIEHAPHLSLPARQIKLADKISNVRAMIDSPPTDWPEERRQEYLPWAKAVVAGLRGCSAPLEALFDETLARRH